MGYKEADGIEETDGIEKIEKIEKIEQRQEPYNLEISPLNQTTKARHRCQRTGCGPCADRPRALPCVHEACA